jgi:hypothetical protein
MDPELVDRIYEASLVPELWPGVLDALGRIIEGIGGALLITKADVQYWAASPGSHERVERLVNEGLLWRGQIATRFLPRAILDFCRCTTFVHPMNWI